MGRHYVIRGRLGIVFSLVTAILVWLIAGCGEKPKGNIGAANKDTLKRIAIYQTGLGCRCIKVDLSTGELYSIGVTRTPTGWGWFRTRIKAADAQFLRQLIAKNRLGTLNAEACDANRSKKFTKGIYDGLAYLDVIWEDKERVFQAVHPSFFVSQLSSEGRRDCERIDAVAQAVRELESKYAKVTGYTEIKDFRKSQKVKQLSAEGDRIFSLYRGTSPSKPDLW